MTPEVGLTVVHRRYVPYSHAHYAGHLVDGAYALGLFGDVATEMCIRTDGDEGLFASYSDVQFRAPMRAGDVLEIQATLTRVGTRSRVMDFECRVVCRGRQYGRLAGNEHLGRPDRTESAAEVLDRPIVAVSATGTVVVPPA
jgi:3-aminobutyryl-CoA ammonia-lyase